MMFGVYLEVLLALIYALFLMRVAFLSGILGAPFTKAFAALPKLRIYLFSRT